MKRRQQGKKIKVQVETKHTINILLLKKKAELHPHYKCHLRRAWWESVLTLVSRLNIVLMPRLVIENATQTVDSFSKGKLFSQAVGMQTMKEVYLFVCS